MNESKMGILSLVLLGAALYALATAMGIQVSVSDMATNLIQVGTDLLHRLLF
ncbi:hypothetical protein LMG31506_02438 [Cupriavidus yeoncheonensis]|uniref:Uncharacterized protein n=1 Tax=Cupriavidus yeoncheonensis TaxID=1462994 RepID=A0A916N3J9_9BURK|nr:hypothetical protein [Cupriavidus yeoncheonensis]CAG2140967.1 hypothetical protein LMG31506_02438 [Cupriavidus yeoncheonensis]